MEKLNTKKEPLIEILRLIEKRVNCEKETKFVRRYLGERLTVWSGLTIINFSIYFYIQDGEAKGDVYFETIGHLK
jgi:hypothetical protein